MQPVQSLDHAEFDARSVLDVRGSEFASDVIPNFSEIDAPNMAFDPARGMVLKNNSVDFNPFAPPPPKMVPVGTVLDGKKPRITNEQAIIRAMARQAEGYTPAHFIQAPSRQALVCGFGPSIGDMPIIKTIRAMQKRGGSIVATNMAHDFLVRKAIIPDYGVLMDPMPWIADYVKRPQKSTKYLLASQCDPKVFDNLKGFDRYLWHADFDVPERGIMEPGNTLNTKQSAPFLAVPGQTTVGLRSFWLMYSIGYRDFHFFGLDSSKRGADHHVIAKPSNVKKLRDVTIVLRTKAGDIEFETNEHMAKQAADFDEMVKMVAEFYAEKKMELVSFTFHGDGLLPTTAALSGWHADPEMNARYGGAKAVA